MSGLIWWECGHHLRWVPLVNLERRGGGKEIFLWGQMVGVRVSSELGTAGQFGEKRRRHGVFLWGQMVGVRVSSEMGTAGQFGEKRRRQGDLSLGSNGRGEGVI